MVNIEQGEATVKCLRSRGKYYINVKSTVVVALKKRKLISKVCTISFERPVSYLCEKWHVFPPKYEAWTRFNRPWTEYQCQGVVWTLLIIFTESVNRSTCLSVYLIITRLRNVNLLCFSDSIEGIDFPGPPHFEAALHVCVFCFMARALWIFPLSTVPRSVISDLE